MSCQRERSFFRAARVGTTTSISRVNTWVLDGLGVPDHLGFAGTGGVGRISLCWPVLHCPPKDPVLGC